MNIFLLLGSFLLLGFLIYSIYLLSYSLLFGAPYAALGKSRTKIMFELLKIKPDEKVVDLGSGDGRLVIEAAQLGADAYGYEINPILVLISKVRTRNMKNAHIQKKDFWKEDLSKFDCVMVYGIFHMMGRLEKKLENELKPEARIVSNHFTFPNWKPTKIKEDVYLYVKKGS